MSLRLVQFLAESGSSCVAACVGSSARRIRGATGVYELALAAVEMRTTLASLIESSGCDEQIDLVAALEQGRILAPIEHPDAARTWLTGTGLTHLGSAAARDHMHAKVRAAEATDSMRMFQMGLEGGKPAGGRAGVQPEWFYKGDGRSIVGPERPLATPDFALDGSEEAEIAGIYLIAKDGTPCRVGFTLANEFSDHVTERTNYLWLAHSKLRPAALGPELLVGDLPADVRGTVCIRRAGEIVWHKPFLTGEANMSHAVRNLEHHHFKYPLFRRPGDLHVHFFGTATLSFSDGTRAQVGDRFEIAASPFALPLRNSLQMSAATAVEIRVL